MAERGGRHDRIDYTSVWAWQEGAIVGAHNSRRQTRTSGAHRPPAARRGVYLTSTVAPAASSCFLASSARLC